MKQLKVKKFQNGDVRVITTTMKSISEWWEKALHTRLYIDLIWGQIIEEPTGDGLEVEIEDISQNDSGDIEISWFAKDERMNGEKIHERINMEKLKAGMEEIYGEYEEKSSKLFDDICDALDTQDLITGEMIAKGDCGWFIVEDWNEYWLHDGIRNGESI